MTNEEIVAAIQSGENVTDNLETLYFQNKGMIFSIARKGGMNELEDRMQDAFLILRKAALQYDAESESSFNAYLHSSLIRGLIRAQNDTGQLKRLPAYMAQRIAAYQRLKAEHNMEYGEDPDKWLVMHNLNISGQQYDQLMVVNSSTTLSLDKPVESDDGDDLTMMDTISDPNDPIGDLIEELSDQEDAERIRAAIDKLKPSQKNVTELRFMGGLSTAETCKRLCMSKDQVRKNEITARQKLRKDAELQRIAKDRGFLSAAAFHGGYRRFMRMGYSSTEYEAIRHLEGFEKGCGWSF